MSADHQDQDTDSPFVTVLLPKARKSMSAMIAYDWPNMPLGCQCNVPYELLHVVDFPRDHDLCDHHRRGEAERWLILNAQGAYNFFRISGCRETDFVLVMRFAFAEQDDAFAFKMVFY